MARKKSTPENEAGPEKAAPSAARRTEILETAAKLICERGYDATSIQDIAQACNLTKAGLYHHIRSKEHLLLEIMHYGMDRFEEQVLSHVITIKDPLDRLKTCMERNILLVTRGWSKEVTIILHEHATLTGESRTQINARKKRYIRFLESSFEEAIREQRIRPVHPKVAAFAFLGMVNWIYKWFHHGGELTEEILVREMVNLFFGGLEAQQKRDKNLRGMVDLLLGGFEVPKVKRLKDGEAKERKREDRSKPTNHRRK
jgi:TetR/AcrR family transcriptional regulator, cholesterol catabolism regulator